MRESRKSIFTAHTDTVVPAIKLIQIARSLEDKMAAEQPDLELPARILIGKDKSSYYLELVTQNNLKDMKKVLKSILKQHGVYTACYRTRDSGNESYLIKLDLDAIQVLDENLHDEDAIAELGAQSALRI